MIIKYCLDIVCEINRLHGIILSIRPAAAEQWVNFSGIRRSAKLYPDYCMLHVSIFISVHISNNCRLTAGKIAAPTMSNFKGSPPPCMYLSWYYIYSIRTAWEFGSSLRIIISLRQKGSLLLERSKQHASLLMRDAAGLSSDLNSGITVALQNASTGK